MSNDAGKKAAAIAAVALVEDGMVLGLGTGSTATFVVAELGRRVAEEGLDVVGLPTSERTAELARSLGIKLTDFASHTRLDLCIDGADEVALDRLDLVKGLGGALLREKLVALSAERLVIVVDPSKLVDRLGSKTAVPVEIVPFGAEVTLTRLADVGATPTLRQTAGGTPYITDGGHWIADCAFAPIADPAALAAELKALTGVVDSGLFVGMAQMVIVGDEDGEVRTLVREGG